MSTSCTTSATGTTTSLVTTDSTSTSFSESLSTAPPTTTTITSDVCVLASISISDLPCLSTVTTITSTLPGIVITTSVPVVTTVPTTETKTLTLFGSSCTVITSADPSSSSPPPPPPPPDQSSLSASVTTPPPITFVSQSASTLGNGQVSMVAETITSNSPPSTVFVPSTGPSAQVVQNSNDGSSSSHVGPIVGGVLAGFFGLLGIVLIIWFIVKRRRRWDDIFDKEDPNNVQPPRRGRSTKRFSLDADDSTIEPKPYQYGLVGQTRSPSVGISPPNSPPASSPSLQLPRHNLPPLLLPTSASTPGLSGGTTLSSRPSTAGSMQPLRDVAPSPPVTGRTHHQNTSSGSSTSVHISPAMPSQWGHHGPSPSADQAYFERSGSPTSMRDYEPPRRLQLANVGDDDVTRSPPTPPRLAGPAMLDGKGRNVRLGSGGPGVLVHTDAGPAPPDFQP
ncbi:hypothetical protein DFH06DRAFT_1463654 [Mycena polygramma]|nr:hypothetical protein DFH06DRAFT_1463654 [Mycena polygramma]